MIAHLFVAREAIEAVSSSHPLTCGCVVCRAADGDREAMEEILGAVSALAMADAGGLNDGSEEGEAASG